MEPDAPKPNSSNQPSLLRFWQELKRRKVMRVAITYAVVAWLIIQVASVTFEGFGIPIWAFRFVILMIILGFPFAIILAWAFELTPDGIKTTKVAREQAPNSSLSPNDQSKRAWMKIGFAAAIPTVIFGALAAFFYLQARTSDSPIEESEKSIAVLPLINMSPDPENAFFADGVQEDILTNLSKIEELLVIGRTSTLGYRDTTKKLSQIGEELGVRYLVEGSVRRASNHVRVTVQLIDSQTEDHVWAQNYDRSLDNIFAIQSEIAKQIADKLQAVLSPNEIERIEYRPTESQEAYDYWIKHRQLTETHRRRNWDQKIALLDQAIALDPEFAEAWAFLSIERLMVWNAETGINSAQLLAKAHHALNTAKRINPRNAYIQWAEGLFAVFADRDLEKSITYHLKALAIDPNLWVAQRTLGQRYRQLGRLAEAQHHYETVLRSEPLSERSNRELLSIYLDSRMWDQARALIRKNLERTDEVAYWLRVLAITNYMHSGDRQTYLNEYKAVPGFQENVTSMAYHALNSRDYPRALTLLESGMQLDRSLRIAKSLLYYVMGEADKLEAYAKQQSETLQEGFRNNPRSETPLPLGELTLLYALMGQRGKMEEVIAKGRAIAKEPYFAYYSQARFEIDIARAYLVLGENSSALDALEAASQMPSRNPLAHVLDLRFIFDQLRGNPRFDKLMEN